MSTPTMASSTPSAKNTKSSKQSKTIILHLHPRVLARFPSNPSSTATPTKPALHHANTPTIVPPEDDSVDKSSESNATPAADNNSLAPPSADGVKKKGAPGQKAGIKRTAPSSADGLSKPRGRPGPKKKPRLADGTIDRTNDGRKGPFSGPAPINAHKLGPKANTGAINAGLRALDRSGKPCRKWERKGFQLKSFTGVGWGVGSWSSPLRDSSTFSGDVKSDTSSTGDVKPTPIENSAAPSDRSNSDANGLRSNGVDSSPAPITA